MKTMTCRDLGGSCDMLFSAETWQGMAALMMNHIRDKHPVVAAMMEANSDNGEWSREVKKEWDATQENRQHYQY
jgi:predicted small metal-binding protein